MVDLVTIVVLVIPFIFVIAITWLKFNEKHKRQRLQADLYAKALEQGQPIPFDAFTEPEKKMSPLHVGLICSAAGIGVALMLWLMSVAFVQIDENASIALQSVSSVGIVPFLVGIAFFIIHFVEKKKGANENAR